MLITFNLILLWVSVLFNFLLTVALIRRLQDPLAGQRNRGDEDTIGIPRDAPAQPFTASIFGGADVSLATYQEQELVLAFVGAQCKHCYDILPKLEELAPFVTRAGGTLVVVNEDVPESTNQLVADLHLSMPVLVAPRERNSFFHEYQVHGTPAYCVINPDGIVTAAGYPSFERGQWKTLAESWRRQGKPQSALAKDAERSQKGIV